MSFDIEEPSERIPEPTPDAGILEKYKELLSTGKFVTRAVAHNFGVPPATDAECKLNPEADLWQISYSVVIEKKPNDKRTMAISEVHKLGQIVLTSSSGTYQQIVEDLNDTIQQDSHWENLSDGEFYQPRMYVIKWVAPKPWWKCK